MPRLRERHLKLARAEARWKAVFELAPVAMMEHDFNGVILVGNPALAELTGRPLEELIGSNWFDLVHPDDQPVLKERVAARAAGLKGAGAGLELRLMQASGAQRFVKAKGNLLSAEAGLGGRVLLHLADVTLERAHREALERATNRLAFQAEHDNLTGLANRALLLDSLGELGAAHVGRAAVFFMDLDRFKAVNDNLGHGVGDELLVVVAKRLSTVVRPTDLVARLGGDEFVILALDIRDRAAAVRIAERACTAVAQPAKLHGHEVNVGCSIGIALFTGESPETLLRQADIALYQAKAAGRERWEFYDPSRCDTVTGRAEGLWDRAAIAPRPRAGHL